MGNFPSLSIFSSRRQKRVQRELFLTKEIHMLSSLYFSSSSNKYCETLHFTSAVDGCLKFILCTMSNPSKKSNTEMLVLIDASNESDHGVLCYELSPAIELVLIEDELVYIGTQIYPVQKKKTNTVPNPKCELHLRPCTESRKSSSIGLKRLSNVVGMATIYKTHGRKRFPSQYEGFFVVHSHRQDYRHELPPLDTSYATEKWLNVFVVLDDSSNSNNSLSDYSDDDSSDSDYVGENINYKIRTNKSDRSESESNSEHEHEQEHEHEYENDGITNPIFCIHEK